MKQRLTFRRAAEIFTPKRETGMSITNDGNCYSIRDDEGCVVHTCVEYLDAVAFIRRANPTLGEWAHGFAPHDETTNGNCDVSAMAANT